MPHVLGSNYDHSRPLKFIFKMKLTTLLFVVTLFQLQATETFGQKIKVSLDLENVRLEQVFDKIESLTEFKFIYKDEKVDYQRIVTVKAKNENVTKVLDKLFKGSNIEYKIVGNQIIIKPGKDIGKVTPPIKELLTKEIAKVETPQGMTITGTIVDEANVPLIGANVLEKGTTNGTVSDIDGKFSLTLKNQNATLVFSYLGHQTLEIVITTQTFLNVVLRTETSNIAEIVVVGYGTQKKATITGAVGTLNAKDFEKRTVTDVRQALQGTVAGVTIIDRGGAPGREGFDFNIRGIGTIGNAGALVLIDGVERNMSNIDADNIESISVLKDAASAAIYGARAANGVILITTKRATKRGLKIEYDAYYGVQGPSQRQQFLGARDYLELINESLVNNGRAPRFSEDYINRTVAGNDSNYPYTDVWNKIIGLGSTNDHSLRFYNGGEVSNTFVSLNYLNQEGLLGLDYNKRLTFDLNNTFNISEKLKFSTDISYVIRNSNAPRDYGIGWGLGDPIVNLKYNNGLYGFDTKNNASALAHLEQSGYDDQSITDLSTRFKAEYNILKDLKLTGFAGYTSNFWDNTNFAPFVEFPDPRNPEDIFLTWTPSSLKENRAESKELTLRLLLNYKLSVKKHSIEMLGGFEQIENKWSGIDAYRESLYSNDTQIISLGDPTTSTNNGGVAEWSLRSYFGRVSYNFDQKYFLESTVRNDGSSRFAIGNKWGLFPSISLGWMVSNEGFMKSFEKLSSFKIRGSYGTLGNQNIGLFKYSANVFSGYDYTFGGVLAPGYNTSYYANKDISWEETTTINIGTDMSFSILGGKVNVVYDWYRRNTKDILLSLPIPLIVGLNPSEINAGKVRNQGWELSLSYQNYTHDLGYNIGFNISDVKNEVVDLAGLSPIISGYSILQEGFPIWASYGWETNGLFADQADIDASPKQPNSSNIKPGDIKFVDRDGNGKIDDADRYVMGSNIPRFTFGLNTELKYKGFDLTALFQGALVSDIYLKGSVNDGPQFQNAATTRFLDRWSPDNPNPNASMPRITADNNYNNTFDNDFWIRDGKYVRLKNIQLGYNFNESIANKISMSSIRVFITGTNVFTISNLESGLDPELFNGWSSANYPTLSTYSMGVNLKF
jgi:TonB-linked SusC/RagA family outer membrane protein